MIKPWLRLLPVSLAGFAVRSAHACTVCDSANGKALRAGLFNGHFLHTLLLVLAPAPVFALVAVLVHHAMPDIPLDSAAPSPMSASALAEGAA